MTFVGKNVSPVVVLQLLSEATVRMILPLDYRCIGGMRLFAWGGFTVLIIALIALAFWDEPLEPEVQTWL